MRKVMVALGVVLAVLGASAFDCSATSGNQKKAFVDEYKCTPEYNVPTTGGYLLRNPGDKRAGTYLHVKKGKEGKWKQKGWTVIGRCRK